MDQPRHVYVVDDNPEVRKSTQLMLEASGYSVECFVSGLVFLESAESRAPGVVLLDLRMPGPDGIEIAEALARDFAKFASVIVTGHGQIDLAVRAVKSGARDFLEKPFREEALLAVVEREFVALDALLETARRHTEVSDRVARLTPRERQVFEAIASGRQNKAIAFALGISVRTVEMYRARLMEKLRVRTVADLVGIAFQSRHGANEDSDSHRSAGRATA